MIQCAGTKRDGSPCTATVEPPQSYCWWHDTEYVCIIRHYAKDHKA
jgi:hypothetical protein